MYRMRRWSAPLSVTLPPPSSTTTAEVLTTLAVSVIDDRHGVGTAVEGDDAAARDRVDDCLRRAAAGRADADHDVGMRGVDGQRLGGKRYGARVTGWWRHAIRRRGGDCGTVDLRDLADGAGGRRWHCIGHHDEAERDQRQRGGRPDGDHSQRVPSAGTVRSIR